MQQHSIDMLKDVKSKDAKFQRTRSKESVSKQKESRVPDGPHAQRMPSRRAASKVGSSNQRERERERERERRKMSLGSA